MQNQNTNDKRSIFDWMMFILIHLIFIGGIGWAGVHVYGGSLGAWVAASAIVEGLSLTYLFAKKVPGETLMKVLLYLFASLSVAYLIHNGAKQMGVNLYNDAQLKKYELGIAQAAQATSRKVAREVGLNAKDASQIEKVFNGEVAVIAAALGFLSLFSALVVFAIASKRVHAIERTEAQVFDEVSSAEGFNGEAIRPKGQR